MAQSARPGAQGDRHRQAALRQLRCSPRPPSPSPPPRTRGRRRCPARSHRPRRAPCTRRAPGTAPGSSGRSAAAAPPPSRPRSPAPATTQQGIVKVDTQLAEVINQAFPNGRASTDKVWHGVRRLPGQRAPTPAGAACTASSGPDTKSNRSQ